MLSKVRADERGHGNVERELVLFSSRALPGVDRHRPLAGIIAEMEEIGEQAAEILLHQADAEAVGWQ